MDSVNTGAARLGRTGQLIGHGRVVVGPARLAGVPLVVADGLVVWVSRAVAVVGLVVEELKRRTGTPR